jgi:hypothetical protein
MQCNDNLRNLGLDQLDVVNLRVGERADGTVGRIDRGAANRARWA